MIDEILSTVVDAPVSYLIYSSLAFYGERRGGEITGTWFVAALSSLGVAPAAVRQTLFRMERDEELIARKVGRVKVYRASAYARAEMQAGTQKIFAPVDPAWDGYWTVVLTQFPNAMRLERERVRNILQVEGFAPLGNGAYVHARDRADRLREALATLGVDEFVTAFRADHVHGLTHQEFARARWDIEALGAEYTAFIGRFAPLGKQATATFTPDVQFALRIAVTLGFLEVAWKDPELPASMLPRDWPGARARSLARRLYDRFAPGALAFGDALAAHTSIPTPT